MRATNTYPEADYVTLVMPKKRNGWEIMSAPGMRSTPSMESAKSAPG
jgi:hypothetical protein